jgi:hypothetical protein
MGKDEVPVFRVPAAELLKDLEDKIRELGKVLLADRGIIESEPLLTPEERADLVWLFDHWERFLGPTVMNDPAYRRKLNARNALRRVLGIADDTPTMGAHVTRFQKYPDNLTGKETHQGFAPRGFIRPGKGDIEITSVSIVDDAPPGTGVIRRVPRMDDTPPDRPSVKRGCTLDTDGDGNCPAHPDGCPK